eukprot:872526-Prymnesium_polylepis.1
MCAARARTPPETSERPVGLAAGRPRCAAPARRAVSAPTPPCSTQGRALQAVSVGVQRDQEG